MKYDDKNFGAWAAQSAFRDASLFQYWLDRYGDVEGGDRALLEIVDKMNDIPSGPNAHNRERALLRKHGLSQDLDVTDITGFLCDIGYVWLVECNTDKGAKSLSLSEFRQIIDNPEQLPDEVELDEARDLFADAVNLWEFAKEDERKKQEPSTVAPQADTSRIYFIRTGGIGPIKIGVTNNVQNRLKALQTAHPWPLTLLATAPGTQFDEKRLHARFAKLRMKGEWFEADEDLLAFIRGLKAA